MGIDIRALYGLSDVLIASPTNGQVLTYDSATGLWKNAAGGGGGGGSGTVTSVSVTTANGVSGSVANSTTTPAITLTLGAITPTTIVASGAISGSNLSGTNTGDQTNISGNSFTSTNLAGGSAGQIPYQTAASTTTFLPVSTNGFVLTLAGGLPTWAVGGSGSGTVTSVSVVTANGVSGSVATATTTPAITLTLGAITPTSVTTPNFYGSSSVSGGALINSNSSGTKGSIVFGSTTGFTFDELNTTLGLGIIPSSTISFYIKRPTARIALESSTTTTPCFFNFQANTSIAAYLGIDNSSGNGLMTTGGIANAFTMNMAGAKPIVFGTSDAGRWQITSAGHILAITNNSYDIGASGATSARSIYAATSLVSPQIVFPGSTSGSTTLTVPAVAGTYSFTLPANGGTNNYVLSTNGSGVTSWVAQSGGGSATITIVDDTTTNALMYPTWVTANTGSLPVKVSSTKIGWNPSISTLIIGNTSVTPFGQLEVNTTINGDSNMSVKNLSSGSSATASIMTWNDLGHRLDHVVTSSTWSGASSLLAADQAILVSNGVTSFVFGCESVSDLIFVVSGNNAGHERMRIKSDGRIACKNVTLSGATIGHDYQVTSGGSTGTQAGLNVDLITGYTGSAQTAGGRLSNNASGTGVDPWSSGSANYGMEGACTGTTTGTNIACYGIGYGGDISYGLFGYGYNDVKASSTHIAVAGFALNTGSSSKQIAGYFGLQAAAPTYASCALMCDNGSQTSNIFVARDNGTAVLTIADGGAVTLTSSITTSISIVNATQTSVNASTSGTVKFAQPQQGTTYKVVIITCAAALGTASYTFPTAFTVTPSVVGTNDAATGIATSISTTAVTITGATTTGSIMLIGY